MLLHVIAAMLTNIICDEILGHFGAALGRFGGTLGRFRGLLGPSRGGREASR